MVLSSLVLVMTLGSAGEVVPSADAFGFAAAGFSRSARLLAQADAPVAGASLSELDNRIASLRDSRRGKGLFIAGLIIAPVVILPTGLIVFFLGLAAETLSPGLGIGSIIVGSVLLAVTLAVVVLCIIGIVSTSSHNSSIDEQIRAAESQRELLLRQGGPKPVSQDWAPIRQITLARF